MNATAGDDFMRQTTEAAKRAMREAKKQYCG